MKLAKYLGKYDGDKKPISVFDIMAWPFNEVRKVSDEFAKELEEAYNREDAPHLFEITDAPNKEEPKSEPAAPAPNKES